MKKVILMFAAMVLLAAPAFGDYYGGRVWYARIGGYFAGNGGEFTLKNDGPPGLLLSNAAYSPLTKAQDGNAESFQTFCVEGAEYVAQPMDIVVSTTFINEANGTVLAGLGSHAILGNKPNGDNLDPQTAYLYTKFATGTLAGYNYAAGAGRIASAGALQQAIWFIEGEAGGANNAFAALALDATTVGGNTDEWVGKGIGDVRVLNTWTPAHVGELAYKQQDQLYMVPAPAAIGLGMLGLALIGWLKRRVG